MIWPDWGCGNGSNTDYLGVTHCRWSFIKFCLRGELQPSCRPKCRTYEYEDIPVDSVPRAILPITRHPCFCLWIINPRAKTGFYPLSENQGGWSGHKPLPWGSSIYKNTLMPSEANTGRTARRSPKHPVVDSWGLNLTTKEAPSEKLSIIFNLCCCISWHIVTAPITVTGFW